MNTQTVKKLAALLITLGAAVSVPPVFAQTAQAAPQSLSRQDTAPATGKTRAQVYAELIQAEEAGLIPAGGHNYPPSAATIARNRIDFALAEQSWKKQGEAAPQTPQVTLQRGGVLNTVSTAGKTRGWIIRKAKKL
ncbi:DUF4148 domain-containing protein [Caballeronia mineralivorans]|uniref:DUF4148 domain-containing protein n=1 Tax=Caballeronia mineralivorans TaxID=2010198 RepID=UPI000AB4E25F|nr:DUF4148 domain-containing protein [Caballeronia mineralivorans]